MTPNLMERILDSRRALASDMPTQRRADEAAEGGCGVLGFASNILIPGRHVLFASRQMHNRGNGKGGGIAMAGLDPAQMRVDGETLKAHYLIQIALLDPDVREEVEKNYIRANFEIAQAYDIGHIEDYRVIEGLEIRPPDVWRYFVRAKPEALARFAEEHGLDALEPRKLEDEFVYQNTFKLNREYYASLGEKRAFVLCHGRDLIVLKIVGYAEQVVEYYQLEDQSAHVWIAHQRYPTKGRVWHPGGAHPFIGLNEALVHNGDFANYHTVSEYLRQRGIQQLFLTDTEVGAQMFDLLDRVYEYPLEMTLEAMAPTTEHDFMMLPAEKQEAYRAVQMAHIHGSPDGPWFFIVARSRPDSGAAELIGITDTSMLRPQVFALYENTDSAANESVQIGLIASERQAINACLRSLSDEDNRFQPLADKYWVARGGSHTDGGAFTFTCSEDEGLVCRSKFGKPVTVEAGRQHRVRGEKEPGVDAGFMREWKDQTARAYDNGGAPSLLAWLRPSIGDTPFAALEAGFGMLREFARNGDGEWRFSVDTLTQLRDRPFDPGGKKRASVIALIDEYLCGLFGDVPPINDGASAQIAGIRSIGSDTRAALRPAGDRDTALVVNALGFPSEGDESCARLMVEASRQGWSRLYVYNWRGGRFAASGLGPDSSGLRIDLYGDAGDYAASGLDGAEVHLHGDGQDQLGQIMRQGKLVIYGDVGQTFLYGAKGGEIYVRGSAAGRPLINAVGRPRVVINGTCLDYLAESFMAGDPLNGGGFVILNGVTLDEGGNLVELESPYPGGNLFSLASGGAIYIRDPHRLLDEDQLNGGVFVTPGVDDWVLIEPHLRENERLFGIAVDELLTVDGQRREPHEVYRKVTVAATDVLKETENR